MNSFINQIFKPMKSILIASLFLILLFSSSLAQNKIKTHYVGELLDGGIVCYVEKNGKHGLIASLEDICTNEPFVYILNRSTPLPRSGQFGNEVPEPKTIKYKYRTSSTDGFANTRMIIKQGYNHGAAWSCHIYNAKNYNDWYLPSKRELENLISAGPVIDPILNKDNDPNTNGLSYAYWSSTSCLSERVENCTWVFKDGIHNINLSDYKLNVRAIRKF